MLCRLGVPRDQHLLARGQVLRGERDGLPALAVHGERAGHQVDLVVLQHLEPLGGGDHAELQRPSRRRRSRRTRPSACRCRSPRSARTAGCASPSAGCRPRRRRAGRRGHGWPPRSAPPGPGRRTSWTRRRRRTPSRRAAATERRRLLLASPAAGPPVRRQARPRSRRAGRATASAAPEGSAGASSWSPVLLHSLRDAAPGQDRRQQPDDQHQPADQHRRAARAGQGVVRLRARWPPGCWTPRSRTSRTGRSGAPGSSLIARATAPSQSPPSSSARISCVRRDPVVEQRRRAPGRPWAGPGARAPRRSWRRTAPRTPPRSRA